MVRLPQDHVRSFDEVPIDFTDDGEKLYRTASDSLILAVSKIGLFQQIEHYILNFGGDICNDCLIIIFIADI